jgi:hypothetical protein
MEALYNLPSGDQVRVIDTATAGRSLGRALQLFREGGTEPLFFGDEPRPQGVVISFDQWAEYEAMRKEVEFERRMEQTARERLANPAPEESVPFDDMVREYGWEDPDADGRKP